MEDLKSAIEAIILGSSSPYSQDPSLTSTQYTSHHPTRAYSAETNSSHTNVSSPPHTPPHPTAQPRHSHTPLPRREHPPAPPPSPRNPSGAPCNGGTTGTLGRCSAPQSNDSTRPSPPCVPRSRRTCLRPKNGPSTFNSGKGSPSSSGRSVISALWVRRWRACMIMSRLVIMCMASWSRCE